jgi:hypothetical protein
VTETLGVADFVVHHAEGQVEAPIRKIQLSWPLVLRCRLNVSFLPEGAGGVDETSPSMSSALHALTHTEYRRFLVFFWGGTGRYAMSAWLRLNARAGPLQTTCAYRPLALVRTISDTFTSTS